MSSPPLKKARTDAGGAGDPTSAGNTSIIVGKLHTILGLPEDAPITMTHLDRIQKSLNGAQLTGAATDNASPLISASSRSTASDSDTSASVLLPEARDDDTAIATPAAKLGSSSSLPISSLVETPDAQSRSPVKTPRSLFDTPDAQSRSPVKTPRSLFNHARPPVQMQLSSAKNLPAASNQYDLILPSASRALADVDAKNNAKLIVLERKIVDARQAITKKSLLIADINGKLTIFEKDSCRQSSLCQETCDTWNDWLEDENARLLTERDQKIQALVDNYGMIAEENAQRCMAGKEEATEKLKTVKNAIDQKAAPWRDDLALAEEELVEEEKELALRALESDRLSLLMGKPPFALTSLDAIHARVGVTCISQLSPNSERVSVAADASSTTAKNTRDSLVRFLSDMVRQGLKSNPGVQKIVRQRPFPSIWSERIATLEDTEERYQRIQQSKANYKAIQIAFRIAYYIDLEIDIEPNDSKWGDWRISSESE